jgi:hypothetical protein
MTADGARRVVGSTVMKAAIWAWSASAVVAVSTAGCSVTASSAPTEDSGRLPEVVRSVAAPRPAAAPGPVVRTVTAEDLGATWRPGCPVAPESLRRVELNYVDPDGNLRRGALVVHLDVVEDVVEIFGRLAEQRYPIEKMQTVENYRGAEDELSMRDNNTSAFNCRPLPGSDNWSLHAYGRAIDLNPLVNPYIDGAGNLEPATAGRYLDRTLADPALLKPGDPAVLAFTDRGWRWGGAWRNPIDYQHFEIG